MFRSGPAAVREAVKAGLDPKKVLEIVNKNSGKSVVLDARRAATRRSRLPPHWAQSHHGEGPSLRLLARQAGFPLSAMPSCSGVGQLWHAAKDRGLSQENVAAAIKVVEKATAE
jgi:3-hydroxyisobutyrate dehydrogenase-like beta-hydroxyacid dehydrogenase